MSSKTNHFEANNVDVERYTTTIFHEMRASYEIAKIISQRQEELIKKITYRGEEYRVEYQVQLPWAGIINGTQPDERYAIFQYMEGRSPRDIAAESAGWNNIPEDLRQLFGQIHSCCNRIANVAVAAGLEPYDLGAHQTLYRFDHENRKVTLSILDCEEYRFYSPDKPQQRTWPQAWIEIGLPTILIDMSLWAVDTDEYEWV